MKRQLNFKFVNNQYVIEENGEILFAIDGNDLNFESIKFYNGIYKDKSAAIDLINNIENDTLNKGRYIFSWLTTIIDKIQQKLNDPEELTTEIVSIPKKVTLFELSACAGDGFYSSGPDNVDSEIDSEFGEADFAVKISGKSMEPTIMDESVVFVKATKELVDGDVGIFIVDGQVMCKRYREEGEEKRLEPDNKSSEFQTIVLRDGIECVPQGKVLHKDSH